MSTRLEKEKAKAQQEKFQAVLSNLLKDDDNKYCVDCDAKGGLLFVRLQPVNSIFHKFLCFCYGSCMSITTHFEDSSGIIVSLVNPLMVVINCNTVIGEVA